MFCIVVVMVYVFTRLVTPLRGGLHDFWGAWRRCNSLEWNVAMARMSDKAIGDAGRVEHSEIYGLSY